MGNTENQMDLFPFRKFPATGMPNARIKHDKTAKSIWGF